MWLSLLGIALLLAPFSLVGCFSDRRKGFLYVFVSVIGFQLLLALLSQSLHVFTYSVLLLANGFAALGSFVFFFSPGNRVRFPSLLKINWLTISAFFIIACELLSLHFSYTGTVQTFTGQSRVEKSAYPYPYFSDEWVGVSLARYSIAHHSLPIVNPLIDGAVPFPNPLVAHFSLISGLFLLLHLDPLTSWPLLAALFGFLVCVFLYLLLRTSYRVRPSVAILAALALPFVLNGANLPGIWFLIPLIPAVSLFLISLIAAELDDITLLSGSAFLSLVLYPPIAVFLAPVIAAVLFKKRKTGILLCFGFLLAAVSILFAAGPVPHFLLAVRGYLFRTNLVSGIPSFAIWKILPILSLPFAVLGCGHIFRRKMWPLLAALISGLTFWIAYAFTMKVFVIDYPRVVIVTAFLCIAAAGIGGEWLLALLQKKYPILAKGNIGLLVQMLVLGAFLLAAFSYPIGTRWQRLTLQVPSPKGFAEIAPAAPINHYLAPDDLRLFSGISGKRFIAPPWKGLVIGAATGNFPLETKPSTITNAFLRYDDFIRTDCAGKAKLAEKFRLSYAYVPAFACADFSEIGASGEGLHLYLYKNSTSTPI